MRHKPHEFAEAQVPINEEWEAREGMFDEHGNLIEKGEGPMVMRGFDSYKSPVTDGGGEHYHVGTRKEQSRLMHEHDAVDSRDVPKSMRNENVRKARGYD